MITLSHAIKIAAPRDKAYQAFTDISAIAGWHLRPVGGGTALGETLILERRPGLRFGWRTDRLEPGSTIVQTCVEGPGASPGKQLAITLSDLADGRTLVKLSDGEWPENDPHLPLCNTYWGEALTRLRTYLET
jgi:uncharacterized protein YndB with AHSA1/START domain